ncbi:MAG: hypothetical protein AAF721_13775 [Myxococcota bacterium]
MTSPHRTLAVAALALACGTNTPKATPAPEPEDVEVRSEMKAREKTVPVQDPATAMWPEDAKASWPRRCLLENIATHPTQPWLAAACTDSEGERGAVLVFDVDRGTLRTATAFDDMVGWSDAGLLRWHPDGTRLATNVSTNGIAVLQRARYVGRAHPDDTRDGGVQYVWVGDRLFADTGAFFEIRQGDTRFDFDELDAPAFQGLAWNTTISAAVGRVDTGIAAYDPVRQAVVYDHALDDEPRGHLHWSGDGRWCARRTFAVPPAPDALALFSGDEGTLRAQVKLSCPRIDKLDWGPAGALAVRCHDYDPKTRERSTYHLDVIRDGALAQTIDLGSRKIEPSHSVPEAAGLAWSPTSDGLALLLEGQQLQILDAHRGTVVSTFHAPAPAIPKGLPSYYTGGHRAKLGFPGDLIWASPQRLVRIAPHFISVWSIDGEKIAEFVVSDAK